MGRDFCNPPSLVTLLESLHCERECCEETLVQTLTRALHTAVGTARRATVRNTGTNSRYSTTPLVTVLKLATPPARRVNPAVLPRGGCKGAPHRPRRRGSLREAPVGNSEALVALEREQPLGVAGFDVGPAKAEDR